MRQRILWLTAVMLLLTTGVAAASTVDSGATASDTARRGPRTQVTDAPTLPTGVAAQQRQLNRLFGEFGTRPLVVDGIAGPETRRMLCGFRLAVGLPVNTNSMRPGSGEEQRLMTTNRLPIPFTSAISSERWVLVDKTCQIMFVGEGAERLRYVFTTSTGASGYPTRLQNRTPVFKYDSASDNGGWHNSTLFPTRADNPLNGNMYRPLYFDRGQAIHGATQVPPYPASKGCVRLSPTNQDRLLDWLGLGSFGGVTFSRSFINLTVNVQGRWAG